VSDAGIDAAGHRDNRPAASNRMHAEMPTNRGSSASGQDRRTPVLSGPVFISSRRPLSPFWQPSLGLECEFLAQRRERSFALLGIMLRNDPAGRVDRWYWPALTAVRGRGAPVTNLFP